MKENKYTKKQDYSKYFAMIESNNYNEVLSVFLIYCRDHNIEWSFPMIFGNPGYNNNEDKFNREFNIFMDTYLGVA